MSVQVEHRYSDGEAYAELSFRSSPDSEELIKKRIADLSTIDDEVREVRASSSLEAQLLLLPPSPWLPHRLRCQCRRPGGWQGAARAWWTAPSTCGCTPTSCPT